MSQAMQVMEKQTMSISVYDAEGKPFVGARLEFFVNGQLAGTVESSSGRAGIEAPADAHVEVRATYNEAMRSFAAQPRSATSKVMMAALHMPMATPPALASQPEARCTDGTTGQPCVNCHIGDITVRICG